ncbi:RNA-binding protein Pasilla isoform X10 [Anopheles maculipalpis]|uniref:RNA-binding protein Pasilla isoform X10 n=2 Tax=Anopheles maculipalpis TaxID=1496333 RepID=UPI002159235B|nr:RNA-binding protein Pasilla isoform X10 [Anopheles maculipalpis]
MLNNDQQQRQYATGQRQNSGQPQTGANGSHSSAENSPVHSNTSTSYFMFDELSSALNDERNNGNNHHHHLQQQQQHHHRQQSSANGSSPSAASSNNSGSTNSLLSNGDSLMARINQLNQQQQQYSAGSARSPSNGATIDGSTIGVVTMRTSPTNAGGAASSLAQQHQQQMLALVRSSGGSGGTSFAQHSPIDATDGTTFPTTASATPVVTSIQQQYGGGGSAQFHSSFAQAGHQPQQQHKVTFYQSQHQQYHNLHQNTPQRPGFGKSPDAHIDPSRTVAQLNHAMELFEATGTTTATTTTATNGGGDNYHFKTLVPSVAAGAIIGKGGETIASLQKDAGARVKMSKSHDFYPGTTERICLISGTVEGILTVLDFITDKIREKPDITKALTEADAKQAQERDKQVKILVPNTTAGMIIGKAGAYIKQIKEESGSYVQISQKPKELTLQERCITIIGEKENNRIACKMILAKIVEDPSSGTCLNVSYADINGPVANFNPTGSPFAASQNPNFSSSTASLNSAISGPLPSATATGLLVNGTGLNLSLNLGAPSPQTNPTAITQLLDHIKTAMRQSGYSDTATAEVHAALGVLAKYGVLGIGVGLQNGTHSTTLGYLGMPEMQQSTAAAAAAASAATGVYGAVGQLNLDSYLHGAGTATPRTTAIDRYDPTTFDPFRHPGTQAATPISINNNAFGLGNPSALNAAAQTLGSLSKSPTPAEMTTSKEKNVEIPEVIVGAILGPAGRSLVEIQHISGANIQISKKGIFAPGTRNRIVTITGQPNAINVAQFLIEERISQEETKRACQTANAAATNKTSAASVATVTQ